MWFFQDKLQAGKQKLSEGQKQRKLYHATYQEVLDWLQKAQQHLKDHQGIDYNKLPEQIQAHQVMNSALKVLSIEGICGDLFATLGWEMFMLNILTETVSLTLTVPVTAIDALQHFETG